MSGILFFKYYFGHTTFLYSFKSTSGHHQSFFNFRSSSRKSQRQKRSRIFYSTVLLKKTSLILRTSTRLALGITQTKTFLLRCQKTTATTTKKQKTKQRKNICTAPFFEGQELHSCLHISVYLYVCISPWENFCSKHVVRFYLVGMGWGEIE